MKSKPTDRHQRQFLISTLDEMLDAKQPLYQLAAAIDWNELEQAFAPLYSEIGRPAKPIRLMVGLLILKYLEDLSDEVVVERWVRDPYYQYFCGEQTFQWGQPCEPSELTHFRNRIGEEGAEKILQCSINIHPRKAVQEKEVVVDTTVQEKNITYPTDSKLHLKIIDRCSKVFEKEDIKYRRSYRHTVPKLRMIISRGHNPSMKKEAGKAKRKLKTISGRLLRELERKLPSETLEKYEKDFSLYHRVLQQQRGDKNKIYSLHEPNVCCYTKGKSHKKYEFGSKVSLTITKNGGLIVGAKNFNENIYDAHTLDPVLDQTERLTGRRPDVCIADQTYRGRKFVGSTEIITTGSSKKKLTTYEKRKRKKRLRRRAAIEPIIGHAKADHRMRRNYLKGDIGDNINATLSAAAFNFRKWINLILFALKLLSSIWTQVTKFTTQNPNISHPTQYQLAF